LFESVESIVSKISDARRNFQSIERPSVDARCKTAETARKTQENWLQIFGKMIFSSGTNFA
jgi:hypothetical protein